MKKVLMFSYFFPPMGGAGVQRIVKFAKYLPEYGYKPVIVCACVESSVGGQPRDDTLIEELPSIQIYRPNLTKFEALLKRLGETKVGRIIPNFRVYWWTKYIKRNGDCIIAKELPDIVFVSGSPFSPFQSIIDVAKKAGIPCVIDLRDPWALDPITYYPTYLHYRYDYKKMRVTCSNADVIIMNTPDAKKAFVETFADIDVCNIGVITNGYDRDDFEGVSLHAQPSSDKLTIVHTGTFETKYAVGVNPSVRKKLYNKGKKVSDLLRYSIAEPDLLARTPYYLFMAIRDLLDRNIISESDLELIFVGRYSDYEIHLVEYFSLKDIVKFVGYKNHEQSVSYLYQANVLFLPLHETFNRMPLIVPGKTYEYLASGKHILALVPDGDTKRFVESSGNGTICVPTDIAEIGQAITDLIAKFMAGKLPDTGNQEYAKRYCRRKITKELVAIFDGVLAHGGNLAVRASKKMK